MDHFQKMKDATYFGNKLRQRKKDYGDGGVYYGLFIVPEMKLWFAIDKFGILKEKNFYRLPW